MEPVLQVRNLATAFGKSENRVRAVNGISFNVDPGEVLAIVGESGSGKSVTMRSVMGIIPMPPGVIESGEAIFAGNDLLAMDQESLRRIRGKDIAMVFQDAMTALNPVITVGRQITEVLREHLRLSRSAAVDRAAELLGQVGIPNPRARLDQYPHEFSGGMRQRAMIALAMACQPKLLIADEPTTALDVTIQAQIIDLVVALQRDMDMSVIWISHDLGVVARIAQRVIVMYAGRVVEQGTVDDVFAAPSHPYTIGLLASLPTMEEDAASTRLDSIPGQPPNAANLPRGCAFAERCPLAEDTCFSHQPELQPVREHEAACHRLDEVQRLEGRLPWQ